MIRWVPNKPGDAAQGGMADLVRLLRAPGGQALGLMALRSLTIAAKFAITLLIARYLGLAELGRYGVITSISAIGPIVLGFGVVNNLGREGARRTPAAVTLPMLQYFLFLVPTYAVLAGLAVIVWPHHAAWIALLAVLLFLDHLQTEMFGLMTVLGSAYGAHVTYFIRFAGWALIYIPLALLAPGLRNLTALMWFWLAGTVVATLLSLVLTREWGWGHAVRRLLTTRLEMPYKHGSAALYVGDVANVSFVYLDRYIVGLFLSPTALGIYVLYWSITNALSNLVTTSFVQIQRGVLVKAANSSGASVNVVLGKVSLASIGMSLGLAALATLLMYAVVPHLGRPEAEAYLPLMFVLSAGLVLRSLYEVVGISFYAYGRDDLVLYSVVGVLVAALILNLSLDPWIGIWGAGAALVASYALGSATRIAMVARGFRLRTGSGEERQGYVAPAL